MLVDAGGSWNINRSPIRVLGDNITGPHSTAIIVGRKTIVACAHSLDLITDENKRNTKAKTHFKYLEDYWIQSQFTLDVTGSVTIEERIPIKLYKFHVDNDWALFVRNDGFFAESEIATIDISLLNKPELVLNHSKAIVLHCPVSLMSGIKKVGEFSVACNTASVTIQNHSTHHVKYEARDLCRGSSGGGVYVYPISSVLGIHSEAIREVDYDEDLNEKTIEHTSKRVASEEFPYKEFVSSEPPMKKKLKSDSETIASVAGGNNGLGSALILCKFGKLMHYIKEIEDASQFSI